MGETFVNPEQVAFHRLLIITRGQPFGTAIFAIPRMGHLMRQQAGRQDAHVVIDHGALGDPVVTGLVVLQPKMRNPVAQGHQEMIFPIVAHAEEDTSLSHQVFIFVHRLRRPLQGGFAISGNIEIMLDGALRGQRDAAKMPSGEHRRIHQRG